LVLSAKEEELIKKVHISCQSFQSLLSGTSMEATRLSVGLAIRQSGEYFRLAILLSSCRLAMERMRASDTVFQVMSSMDGASFVTEMVVDQLTTLCGMSTPTSIACSESDAAAIRDMIRTETAVVMRQVDVLLGYRDRESLQDAWAMRPVFSGDALKDLFSSLPTSGGVIFKQVTCPVLIYNWRSSAVD